MPRAKVLLMSDESKPKVTRKYTYHEPIKEGERFGDWLCIDQAPLRLRCTICKYTRLVEAAEGASATRARKCPHCKWLKAYEGPRDSDELPEREVKRRRKRGGKR